MIDRLLARAFLATTVAILALAAVEAVVVDAAAPTLARLAGVALCAPPLLARRRLPLLAIAGGVAVISARAALGHFGAVGFSQTAFLAVLAWSGGRWVAPAWRAAVVVLAVVAGMALTLALAGGAVVNDYLMLALMVALCGAGGVVVRRRSDALVAERAERDRVRTARDAELARALAADRRRIARELHDVLGHALTVLSVHSGAARALLGKDADAARPHVEAMQQAADAVAAELGALRATIAGVDHGTAPGVEDLRVLVAEAGDHVTLDLRGGPVPASAGLAAYRIVQEALTNARKHAPGAPVDVAVAAGDDALRIRVVNGPRRSAGPAFGRPAPPLPSGGHGLIGMAERTRLYGGTVEAGPTGTGGWAVTAVLPLGASGAEPAEPARRAS